MASPSLSRTPSAHSFAPGPHRRSHPNLQNLHTLSLAPLTPKYPIDPADYDAYYDPSTHELHSSSSLSHISSLPSPGGILSTSPVRSRTSSRNRLKRKVKSHVNILEPEREAARAQEHSGDNIVGELHDDKAWHKGKVPVSKSQSHLPKLRIVADPSWLVQTGLSLTESSRETKGQSWISKRDSSTSLANMPVAEGYGYAGVFDGKNIKHRDGQTPRSGRATPARSRVGSRVGSRNVSRSRGGMSELRMTSGSPDMGRSTSFATAPDTRIREEDEGSVEDVEPDWADARTQAEVAAQIQEDLAVEFDDDLDDGDPYGILDFDGQGDGVGDSSGDEEEVKRAMRSWGIGGWMDGAIEALLMVEESEARTEGSAEKDEDGDRQELGILDGEETGVGDAEGPPQRVKSVWEDLAWFGRVVRRNVAL